MTRVTQAAAASSKFRVFRFFSCAVVLCAFTATLFAQDDIIKANVPLVLVPVTVRDHKGNLIDGLSADDFVLAIDSVKQKIHLDTSDTVVAPVSLVVAVQCSGISATVLAKINKVGAMIQPLVTGDRGKTAVIAFDDEVRVFQDFTSDGTKIRVAFEKIEGRVIKKGHMIDGVAAGVKMLETRPESSRRILLVLSESRDRGSKTKLPAAIEAAQRAGVMIYPATYSTQATPWTARPEDNPPMPGGDAHSVDFIGPLAELMRLGKTNAAEAFARATGGRHLSFETLSGLEEAIMHAGEEIHSQYLLSFVPPPTSPGFHQLVVAVPSRSDAVTRARPGYWSQ
jgi:VWFA-related protein